MMPNYLQVISVLTALLVCITMALEPTEVETSITGTCKWTKPFLDLNKYFNQEAMLVKDLSGVDVSGSNWDMAKDGAFAGYHVYLCAVTPTPYPGYPPAGFWELMEKKGFTVRRSCLMATELTYPAYHVFVLVDRSLGQTITNADAAAIGAFYVRGGGIYALSDNCPYSANVNKMLQSLPPILAKMNMWFDNQMTAPYPLSMGNPLGGNQFGHHDAFTGVASMTSGLQLSVPLYDNTLGVGVFAPMATVVINRVPFACSGQPAPSFVTSHASMMSVDPPVQLVDVPDSCNWGRIVLDMEWYYRYSVPPMRTGSHRFAANVVAWLVNIELAVERASGSRFTCSRDAPSIPAVVNRGHVIGCSSGDRVTLVAPAMMICSVSFIGSLVSSPPRCSALVVTAASGSACVVDLQGATIGTYWIMANGQNTSLQFSVTAAMLSTRGSVVAVTGACVKVSDTVVRGCRDGSSITIDWSLPYPRELTIGISPRVSFCQAFTVTGTQVQCTLSGLNVMPSGSYVAYINNIPTGILLLVMTSIAPFHKVLCSSTTTYTVSQTSSQTSSTRITQSPAPTRTLSLWLTLSLRETTTRTVSQTYSTRVSHSLAPTRTITLMVTATVEVPSLSVTRTLSGMSGTRSVSAVASPSATTMSQSDSLSSSTWVCALRPSEFALSLPSVDVAKLFNDSHSFGARPIAAVSAAGVFHASANVVRKVAVATIDARAIERGTITDTPHLAFNLTFNTKSVSVSRWGVSEITFSGQRLNFTAESDNTSPWTNVLVEGPTNGWLASTTPLLLDRKVELRIVLSCDASPVLIINLHLPAPGLPINFAQAVTAAMQYSQLVAMLAGSATSGSVLGRAMATRSIVLCGSDVAIDGVLDFDLNPCGRSTSGGDVSSAAARSAVLSNFVLIGCGGAALMFIAALWAHLRGCNCVEGMCAMSFPSTLLPACTVVLPSTFAGVAIIAVHVVSSSCLATDIAIGLGGVLLVALPIGTILSMWRLKTCGSPPEWECLHHVGQIPKDARSNIYLSKIKSSMQRRWKWQSTPERSVSLQCAWVLLLEYRVVWYSALDNGSNALLAALSVAGGLASSSTSLCRVSSVLIVVLLAAHLVVLAITRPFTTLFAFINALMCMSLTLLSVIAQVCFVEVSSSTSSGLWLVELSVACNLLVVSVSMVSVLADMWAIMGSVHRKLLLLRNGTPDVILSEKCTSIGDLIRSPPDDVSRPEVSLSAALDIASASSSSASPVEAPSVQAPSEQPRVQTPSSLEELDDAFLQQLECAFWDASGRAIPTAVDSDDELVEDLWNVAEN